MNQKIIKNKENIIFVLGLLLFVLLSLHSFSDICCMFSATRYYGWPYPYITLQKTVETLEEAELIKTETTMALLQNGWRFHFVAPMTGPDLIGSPLLGFLADMLLSFSLVYFLFFAWKKIIK